MTSPNSVMTVGSLFSGIGGFDLGLERAGMRTMWFCEIDSFCQRVLEKHWPDVLRVPDIRDVGAGTVPWVDVLAGGFPCQDLSWAGLGAGLAGERSGLWSEYARVIRELRPRYVIVENVAALLARGLGTVLADLAALGYDAEWDCIPASAVGAPHRRDRVWLVAYPDARRRQGHQEHHGSSVRSELEAPQRHDADGLRDDVAYPNQERRNGRSGELRSSRRDEPADGGSVGDPEGYGRGPGRTRRPDPASEREPEPVRSLQDVDERPLQPWRVGGRAAQAGGPEWWAVEPPVGRVAHGIPDRLDQLAALGNALVPQIAEWIGRRIIEYEGAEVTEQAA